MKQKIRLGDCYALTKHKPRHHYIRYIGLLAALTTMCLYVRAQRPDPSGPALSGIVTDTANTAILGATITIRGTNTKAITGRDGRFNIQAPKGSGTLSVSYLGHQTINEPFDGGAGEFLFVLVPTESMLEEVEVSTGYQTIPKERATGSFVHIDNGLLNRKVGSNVLDRLDGVASGLLFNRTKTGNNTPDISIRNRSTVFANPDPLIILDDFPYDGGLDNINPQDVESITVLKDASAASIWGARAGNGVIVITTKKGAFNRRPTIRANANVTIGSKPDVFYLPQLTGRQFVEVEESLFNSGRFNSIINNGYGAVSPVVEVLLSHRDGEINQTVMRRMLDSIASYDVRNELNSIYHQNGINQQYQLSIEGGGEANKYYVSGGYDKIMPTDAGNSQSRFTLNASNAINLVRDRVQLSTGIMLSRSNRLTGSYPFTPLFPYERTIDAQGNALPVIDRNRSINLEYAAQARESGLLDWHYRPYDELQKGYFNRNNDVTDYRVNNVLKVEITEGVRVSAHYSFQRGLEQARTLSNVEAWNTRNQINQMTQISQPGGDLIRPLPLGAIYDDINHSYVAHSGRTQLEVEKRLAPEHGINALVGYELKHYRSDWGGNRLYGYDEATATDQNSNIDFTKQYPLYYNPGLTTRLQTGNSSSWSIDRFRSYYANVSYDYAGRYVVSASARKDASNIFGVETNRKGVPLWSIGILWDILDEGFFQAPLFQQLKIRATYGFNGNVDKTTSSYLTARRLNIANTWGNPYLEVQNPPNPSLRWEKVENLNLGIEWAIANGRIVGSVEIWRKRASDLIGNSPIAPQSGVEMFKGNSADMISNGVDLTLRTKILNSADFGWESFLLFNQSKDRISKYLGNRVSNNSILNSNFMNPVEGYSYYALFATRFMRLDGSGNPVFLQGGSESQDYTAILNGTDIDDIIYKGTVTPSIFGSLRNDFHWKGIQLSFNITYKFGQHFRRQSLNNSTLYAVNPSYQQADFDKRWKVAGDELNTVVPSLIYPANSSRSNAYTNADVLVERGDHIRLQDLRLAYTVTGGRRISGLWPSIQVYMYANNLWLIWKATEIRTDPDSPNGLPPVRQLSAGVKIDF